MISDSRIQLQFDVEKPVDLVDLTMAFQSFNRQYAKFIASYLSEKDVENIDEDSVRLFVTRIESNCILAELGWVDPHGLFPGVLVMMDNVNTIREFLKNISFYLDYFRGAIGEIPENKQLGKRDCEDFKNLLAPVVKAGKGSLKYKELKYDKEGKPSTLTEVEYVTDEAVKATQGVTRRIELLEKTTAADHEKVLLSLVSVQEKILKPESKRTHDYGTIESICPKPLAVYWLSEVDQMKVKGYDGNPFKCSFVVDVNVETKHDEPRAYRVVKLHDILPDDE